MKMICAQAKTTDKRGKRIDAVIQKYPELWPDVSLGERMQYSYILWMEEGDQTVIELQMRDDSKVERLAAEMRACGCVVKVMTEKEYRKREGFDEEDAA
jgi:hypothetical protein